MKLKIGLLSVAAAAVAATLIPASSSPSKGRGNEPCRAVEARPHPRR